MRVEGRMSAKCMWPFAGSALQVHCRTAYGLAGVLVSWCLLMPRCSSSFEAAGRRRGSSRSRLMGDGVRPSLRHIERPPPACRRCGLLGAAVPLGRNWPRWRKTPVARLRQLHFSCSPGNGAGWVVAATPEVSPRVGQARRLNMRTALAEISLARARARFYRSADECT